MSEQPQTPVLNSQEVGQMTGHELLSCLGIERDLNKLTVFQTTGGRTYNAWQVWSNRYSRAYVHLTTEVTLRIVTPSGQDTGDRVQDVIHLRGKSADRVIDYQEVR